MELGEKDIGRANAWTILGSNVIDEQDHCSDDSLHHVLSVKDLAHKHDAVNTSIRPPGYKKFTFISEVTKSCIGLFRLTGPGVTGSS